MTAVVHVRAGADHFTERGHFKLPVVAAFPVICAQAEIGRMFVRTDAQAGELLIGEVVTTYGTPNILRNARRFPDRAWRPDLVRVCPIQEAVIG